MLIYYSRSLSTMLEPAWYCFVHSIF